MSITVLHPGLLTTVQDMGRVGYQRFGVPVSGVVDPHSAAIANILVGNEDGEAVLECTMLGPQLQFDRANCIAITGGDLGPTLDGRPVPNYRAIRVQAGQVLRFAGLRAGCRAFIAFAGGLAIEPVMGSRSTYMKAGIGGLSGRKLEAGDVIGFRAPQADLPSMGARRTSPAFYPRPEYRIHVILGPQDDAFTESGVHTFLRGVYTVTPAFDRMGCRLDGPVIEHKAGGDIISDGISFGAVQVPASGLPILMLSDRQTVGGYTKIATVMSADFGILAQLKMGDRLRFAKVSIQFAQKALLDQRTALNTLRRAMQA